MTPADAPGLAWGWAASGSQAELGLELGTIYGKVLRGGGCPGSAGRPRGPGDPGEPRSARADHVLGDKFRRKLGSRAGISPAGQPPGQVASIGVSPLYLGAPAVLPLPPAVVDACSVFLTGITGEGEGGKGEGDAIGSGRAHVTVPRQWRASEPGESNKVSPLLCRVGAA